MFSGPWHICCHIRTRMSPSPGKGCLSDGERGRRLAVNTRGKPRSSEVLLVWLVLYIFRERPLLPFPVARRGPRVQPRCVQASGKAEVCCEAAEHCHAKGKNQTRKKASITSLAEAGSCVCHTAINHFNNKHFHSSYFKPGFCELCELT